MSDVSQQLVDLKDRVTAACLRAGRAPDEVRIVAVSKTFGPDAIAEAARAGQLVFGESKVQEARQKIPLCPGHLEWHLVGHLQRNKVRDAVELFTTIHSVDSVRLLEAIEGAAEADGRRMTVFLEVNVSGEPSKYGLKPEDVPSVLERANALVSTAVRGLMTVPPFDPDVETVRPHFRRLRELRDEWAARFSIPDLELSMGMSQDFELAIEEGATWIRVGSHLFGSRVRMSDRGADEPGGF